jgi:hypothetical protein
VSCKTTSNLLEERITPVTPPKVNRKINPLAQSSGEYILYKTPHNLLNHLKILIPVGTAIIIVAAVK